MSKKPVSSETVTVAHFRRWFFRLTETFIYNVIRSSQQSWPVCIALEKDNIDAFPLDSPVLELYSWSPKAILLRRLIGRFLRVPRYRSPSFDHPRTYRAIRRHGVSVLHAHFGYTGVELLSVKRRTGLPIVTTFYGHDISVYPQSEEWRRKYDLLFRQGDLFLVEGPFMRERLHELGCPTEKSAVVPIGLCLDRYRFRPRSKPETDRPIKLFFCGRFREKKGLIHALSAVRQVSQNGHHIEFHIIGDGELRPQIETYITDNNMATSTILHGSQLHERVVEELETADILLAPSIVGSDGDSEGGAPTILLEAQACGVPIVASSHADIPNVVLPGESALLSPEGNEVLLAQDLDDLLSHPERWSTMGEKGRRFVEDNHDIRKVVHSLEQIYLHLSNRPNKSSSGQ